MRSAVTCMTWKKASDAGDVVVGGVAAVATERDR